MYRYSRFLFYLFVYIHTINYIQYINKYGYILGPLGGCVCLVYLVVDRHEMKWMNRVNLKTYGFPTTTNWIYLTMGNTNTNPPEMSNPKVDVCRSINLDSTQANINKYDIIIYNMYIEYYTII